MHQVLESAKRLITRRPRAIWLEDNSHLVTGFANILKEHHKSPVDVHVVEKVADARKAIASAKPDILLVDLRLQQSVDGIAFIRQFRKTHRNTPVRIVSSFVEDYRKLIHELPNIGGVHDRMNLAGKVGEQFVDAVIEDAYVSTAVRQMDILSMRLKDIAGHKEERAILRFHSRLFRKRVDEALKRHGWAWVAFCGDEEADGGPTLRDFPNDEDMARLDEEFKRAPFVYAAPVVSEESGADHLLEHYPKCTLRIATSGTANVDTGTNRTLVSEALCGNRRISALNSGKHHGLKYEYGFRSEQVFLLGDDVESDREIGPVPMTVAVVLDWEESPWVIVNRDREAVVGRDLFSCADVVLRLTSSGNPGAVRTLIQLRDGALDAE